MYCVIGKNADGEHWVYGIFSTLQNAVNFAKKMKRKYREVDYIPTNLFAYDQGDGLK